MLGWDFVVYRGAVQGDNVAPSRAMAIFSQLEEDWAPRFGLHQIGTR